MRSLFVLRPASWQHDGVADACHKQIDTGATLVSGIAAVLSLDGSGVPRSEVERMANVLKPYGPDRQKILIRGNAAFVFCLHKLTPEDSFERPAPPLR